MALSKGEVIENATLKRTNFFMAKYDYDIVTIGLGPAGMAVSIMGSEMGLNVCAIEKHKIGGECMNVGCIPSKALLRMAKTRAMFNKLDVMELESAPLPGVKKPFERIKGHIDFINREKTVKMFDKVDLVLGEGVAEFVDAHTVKVGDKTVTGRRIFICVGTRPSVPDFEGVDAIDYLTNENMFSLEKPPSSMIVVGGGAIACEMAQAFARLGTKVTIIIRGPRLMWREDPEATDVLEASLAEDGVEILKERGALKFEKTPAGIAVKTDKDDAVEAETVLFAAGRVMDFSSLKLENAGIEYTEKGIVVDRYLRTSRSHVYACGDCNGYHQFSHAAMHQGMIALMNSMMPFFARMNFKKFVVPWTVFTEPQFSRVGMSERELKEKGINYEVITTRYGDYGAAIAESVDKGFIKVFASSLGKIFGVHIIGEGSGEMINEWSLAVQKKIRLHDIMMLQHSFPTMGFLTKRSSENWMMKKMGMPWLKSMCRFMFRF